MVFRKYRAVKQWGKMDTRIFKEIYNARNKRKMPSFKIPEAVQAIGAKVYETNDPFLFTEQAKENNAFDEVFQKSSDIQYNSSLQDHPLYQNELAHVYESSEALSDGIAQASILTNSVTRNTLPEAILNHSHLEIEEEAVRDAILHGEKYDPTLEKLPKRFDPVLFWVTHPRVHGTPVIKRNNIILNNLMRQITFAGLRSGILKSNLQINRDEPLSAILKTNSFKHPLVIRGQPHLTIHSTDPIVNAPWAGKIDVKEASEESLPDIYPISPFIDLQKESIYNPENLITRSTQNVNLHSILWAREQDAKYPWTREQNMANAIMMTYAAAVANATRNGNKTIEKPMLVRGVQLVNGRLDLVAIQLNTLDTANGENPTKNIVWFEKGLRLYKPKPYYEQMTEVENLNMDVFKKLTSLMLGFGSPHNH
ncbi:unnamed protein product [Caenorhabditis bovis]|uniref:39S ribosomal protein L37, mitochondrial n=1 Tax=Caenorhabditis bovis TaxID=2654633 RepID=A0A8S1FEU6_9PELO|nr:unnamed protein product [Caenorhabditis bovis]